LRNRPLASEPELALLEMLIEVGLSQELSEAVVKCFVCYLAGRNRPVHKALCASEMDVESAFENEFQGMIRNTVALSDLVKVRRRLLADLARALTSAHRRFLLSMVKAQLQWELMTCSHIRAMPVLKCKLGNLEEFEAQTNEFEARFEIL
jgi:hypothetical protein